MKRWKRALSLAVVSCLTAFSGLSGASAAVADTAGVVVGQVQGEILLTVSLGNEEAVEQQLTIEDLQGFAAESFETATIWTTGPQEFTGVPLATLMSQFNLSSGVIEARAVNDYMVEIPLSDAVTDGPIVAYLRNGETMSLRGKGPLWLVYPYDSNPAFRTEMVYSRSIWQLDSLTVRPTAE